MNKKTQMIIGIAAVAGLGYMIWKKNQKPTGFVNAAGGFARTAKRRTGGGVCTEGSPTCNICGESCLDGKCYVPVYDENGNVTYRMASCGGTGFGQMSF